MVAGLVRGGFPGNSGLEDLVPTGSGGFHRIGGTVGGAGHDPIGPIDCGRIAVLAGGAREELVGEGPVSS